jgi:hypothetical protein
MSPGISCESIPLHHPCEAATLCGGSNVNTFAFCEYLQRDGLANGDRFLPHSFEFPQVSQRLDVMLGEVPT